MSPATSDTEFDSDEEDDEENDTIPTRSMEAVIKPCLFAVTHKANTLSNPTPRLQVAVRSQYKEPDKTELYSQVAEHDDDIISLNFTIMFLAFVIFTLGFSMFLLMQNQRLHQCTDTFPLHSLHLSRPPGNTDDWHFSLA